MDTIRNATRADIPRLIELGYEFATLSQSVHKFNVDYLSIVEFVNEIVGNPNAIVLVLESDGEVKGFIAGVINKIYFSKDIALQELAWYVKKGCRGILLLEAFEKMARVRQVNKLIVGNKPAYCDLRAVYERRGFSLLENQYTKDLGCQS